MDGRERILLDPERGVGLMGRTGQAKREKVKDIRE